LLIEIGQKCLLPMPLTCNLTCLLSTTSAPPVSRAAWLNHNTHSMAYKFIWLDNVHIFCWTIDVYNILKFGVLFWFCITIISQFDMLYYSICILQSVISKHCHCILVIEYWSFNTGFRNHRSYFSTWDTIMSAWLRCVMQSASMNTWKYGISSSTKIGYKFNGTHILLYIEVTCI